MSRLLIIGAGGHGKVVADAALSMRSWEQIAFVDDKGQTLGSPLGLSVVGTVAQLAELARDYRAVSIAIGNVRTRLELLQRCKALGMKLPVIAHSSSAVSSFAVLEEGCVVFAHAAVNPGARLGAGCIVNTGASVDHDCELGEGVHVGPGVQLAGDVRVGVRTWIGIGACVLQGIVIGSDVMIGAGSVVVSNVESGLTVMGVPARPR
jgi:sugar O-acyltransferase (sialic acid O-acetyltransferase NeuD family)